MRFYEIARYIDASPEVLWAILTDPKVLSSGPFGITQLSGEIAVGSRIKLKAEVGGDREFAITVKEMQAPSRMVWADGMPLGLFAGTRVFSLAARDGGTDFKMREDYTGPLAGLMFKMIPDMTGAFAKFADGIEQVAAEARQ